MHDLLLSRLCVLIVGVDELIREGLFFLVSRLLSNATIFVTDDDEKLNAHIDHLDLILFLLSPPYLDGIETMHALRKRYPAAALIVLSDRNEDYLIDFAAENRVNGFLLVSDQVESLQAAIVDVLSGKPVFPDGRKIMPRRRPVPKLTPRQMEVYDHLCCGKTNKEIGALLSLSDNTVRTHVSAILDALNVSNRTEATKLEKLFRRN